MALTRLVFLISFILQCLLIHSQNVQVKFQGDISDDKGNISGAQIQVTQGGKVVNTITTDGSGRYAFELPLGGDYLVTVSKEGYIAKKFTVNTQGVPPERATTKFPIIQASLGLFKKMEGIDYSALNQPLNKYKYSGEADNFEYDGAYLEQMLAKVESIKAAEKELLKKEKDKEANYAAAIKLGDKQFGSKDLQGALASYQEAQKLKPGEAYPGTQIAAINKAIADAAAKKAAEEAAAKSKADADALAKKQAEEAAAKKAAEEAAAKAKADADALAKKQAEDAAAKKAAEDAAAKAKADKEAADKLAKEKADADAKAKADAAAKAKADKEAADKKAADEAAAKAKTDKEAADKLAKEKADAEVKARAEADAKAKADKEAADKKAAEEAAAKAKADKEAADKKAAEDAAAKAKTDKEAADKLAREKADADAKAKADAAAKAKADADALAKKQADEAAAKAKADKEAADKLAREKANAADKAKADADALAKKQADEAAAKAKADKEAADKLAREKADAADKAKTDADALSRKQAEDAAAKAKADKEAADKLAREKTEADTKAKADKDAADKLARGKAEADARAKAEEESKKAQEQDSKYKSVISRADAAFDKNDWPTAKLGYTEAIGMRPNDTYPKNRLGEVEAIMKSNVVKQDQINAKSNGSVLQVLGGDAKYKEAVKRGDELFTTKRYKEAKKSYEDALTYKGGDAYAKGRLVECEKMINADDNQKTDERVKQLLAKYGPGVTEETISGNNVVILQRVVVRDNMAWIFQKKMFNWGGVAYFRDNLAITESTFEQETKP
jgi:hypothetical protein